MAGQGAAAAGRAAIRGGTVDPRRFGDGMDASGYENPGGFGAIGGVVVRGTDAVAGLGTRKGRGESLDAGRIVDFAPAAG